MILEVGKQPIKPNAANKDNPRVLLVMDMYMAYGRGLLRGIAKYCKIHRSWQTHLQKAASISEIFQLAQRWGADAIIADIPYEKHQEKLLSLDIPFITTLAPPKTNKQMYYIEWDNFSIGAVAARYYLDNHFKSYAFCGYKDFLWSKKRGQGFCQTLQTKGFSASVYERPRSHTLQRGTKELASLADWLKDLAHPIAVFACNDARARHVIEACELAHLQVPQEVAVIGTGNDEIECDLFNPPLSSIDLNIERAGYEAAELLQKLIVGQQINSNVILIQPKYVVERESTNL